MAKATISDLISISVKGVVQGVGFRPFVYQLANQFNLKGFVCNTSEDVRIEVEGDTKDIERFLLELPNQAPPLSHIESITANRGPQANYKEFNIRPSTTEEGKYQLVSPDIATCPDCLREIFNPEDRRYRYPFTNCTNCGPRFTIIADIPYDRLNTTMSDFRMCPECQREYEDPFDRRFHAQPNACPECGPQMELKDCRGNPVICADAIGETSQLLKQGKIIAVKGLGGFLLACNATDQEAVNRLRRSKNRPAKPLAVMVSSLDEAREHCYVNNKEAELLASPGSPIVLMKWKADSSISKAVAPGLKYLGIMLPYTPLHHILLRETGLPLVMSSGNLSEEPIAKDNDEAIFRLAGIADYFLTHNRDIYARYDDSVTFVERGVPRLIRRARGYAPHPIRLNCESRQILGCGAEEKNTFCLTRDNFAFVSQHIGDMENLETLESFKDTVNLYKKLFRIEPRIVAHDLHPEYLTTKYAKEQGDNDGDIKLIPVQHHHAHIVSCMVDNGIEAPVIGIALDGTGYGSDGNIWGGEFMVAEYKRFNRMGHLEYLPLPGGALAIKKPYRTAIGYLLSLGIDLDQNLRFLDHVEPQEINIIKNQIEKNINSPLASSCGRLFDAVAALIGVRGEIEYEAQAAIELEMLAWDEADETGLYPFSVDTQDDLNIIKLQDLFTSIISDLRESTPQAIIAARFHNTIARIIIELCQIISTKTGINQVALSGGVFQNRLLLNKAVASLESNKFEVFTHRQVPCNDGGISLGQVVIANFAGE